MSNVQLWATTFGDEYTVRNEKDYSPRTKFFSQILNKTRPKNVLEIGCNTGMNLGIISMIGQGDIDCWGIDVNLRAVNLCNAKHKNVNACVASGFDLPFRDQYFDLVFTAGVLIHQNPGEVEIMMQEIMRVSASNVLAIEYASDIFEEIPYHGKKESLYKGPYGDLYEKKYGLRLLEHGVAGKREGFDECDYWLLSTY